MTYLVSTIRLDTGDTLVAERCDSLDVALKAKRDVFRHHRLQVGDVPVPFDLDFDHPYDLDRLRTSQPLWPLPSPSTSTMTIRMNHEDVPLSGNSESRILGAAVVRPTTSQSRTTNLKRISTPITGQASS